eukprot:1184250-Amorphochlora_amoeboformis.AAC.1
MADDSVRAAFEPYLERLYKSIFVEVASLDNLSSEDQLHSISFREYAAWLSFRGLLSRKTGYGLTRRQASMAFALPIEPYFMTPELHWGSFLECLARIADAAVGEWVFVDVG